MELPLKQPWVSLLLLAEEARGGREDVARNLIIVELLE